ncbi:hypothetical protein K523DRAFT_366514 [Schizophyllum commune Tattone D]|nr:hypothetical protein K523DRAFT_366514 [Schizophyllum commune Tattone D]
MTSCIALLLLDLLLNIRLIYTSLTHRTRIQEVVDLSIGHIPKATRSSVMSILRGTFYSRSCVPSSQSIHVASTWTCDESDEDVRRMVISPGLVSQKADVHRDSFGRHYAQVPDCHALCYAISYTNIVKMCKARPVDCSGQKCDYGDECFTIFMCFERLEAATGITRGRGLHECELKNGQPIIMMLVACSDKVEAIPRPAARIRAFQQFLGTRKEPMVKRFVQPKNDEDVRRMVITPGMIDRKAIVHRDALGRSYNQLPDYHGLCYAITYSNIYEMCKARPRDRKTGEQCFFGDRCFTIYKWFERLEAATGISRGHGAHEGELPNGQPIIMMVIACSVKVDTVPRPAARIQAFKDFLRTKREPMVKRFIQPRMYSS